MPLYGPRGEILSATEVNLLHTNDDLDAGPLAHHHTLGNRKNQAAPGDHLHNGQVLKASGIAGMGPPVGAFVATQQSTTSTSYVDLATVGPEVTLVCGPTGNMMFMWEASFRQDGSASTGTAVWISLLVTKVSDSSTILAAADSSAIQTFLTSFSTGSYFYLLTGLTPGESYKGTLKYRTSSSGAGTPTCYAQNRRLFAWNSL